MGRRSIKQITSANLPLELIEYDRLAEIKSGDPTYVTVRELRSSRKMMLTEDLTACYGICLLDGMDDLGAIAHNHPDQDPYKILKGIDPRPNNWIEDPDKIFENMEHVTAINVYNGNMTHWSEERIGGALRSIGINRIFHISIKFRIPSGSVHRDLALDPTDKSVYIFPSDWRVGLKFSPMD